MEEAKEAEERRSFKEAEGAFAAARDEERFLVAALCRNDNESRKPRACGGIRFFSSLIFLLYLVCVPCVLCLLNIIGHI